MKYNPLKKLELSGKKIVSFLFGILFGGRSSRHLSINSIKKILVFRLDQKIGNGLLLIPLLNAIRQTNPDIKLHLHIHYPIAELLNACIPGLVDKYWPYRQKELLKNPFLFLKWIYQLRQEKYDLIISSTNPDNFSVSQAIFGRICHPKLLIGFSYKNSSRYYDAAIFSSAEKHYAESQLDLWRFFKKEAKLSWPRFEISNKISEQIQKNNGIKNGTKPVLIWVGATGDKVLPSETILMIYKELEKNSFSPIIFAAGPGDSHISEKLPDWISRQVIIWKDSLIKTAAFFSLFGMIISADTGPAHLAVAMDVPTITIFISSKIGQYGYNDGKRHFSFELKNPEQTRTFLNKSIQALQNVNG